MDCHFFNLLKLRVSLLVEWRWGSAAVWQVLALQEGDQSFSLGCR